MSKSHGDCADDNHFILCVEYVGVFFILFGDGDEFSVFNRGGVYISLRD